MKFKEEASGVDSGSDSGSRYCRTSWGGWRATFGSNLEAVALYRISLGTTLLIELVSRFRYLHAFYSDEGTLPLRLLLPTTDPIYRALCIHCLSGSMTYMRILLSVQCLLAAMLVLGYRTRMASMGSWLMYLSLTLRNTWLNFILDRYFHHLLFYSMFLPLDGKWTIDTIIGRGRGINGGTTANNNNGASTAATTTTTTFVTPATVALKLLVAWIYWDAGCGKYTDPLGGWTLDATPLPALDTYVRHTVGARYMYGLLGPKGLRLMTPTVVYAEMFCAPLALAGSYIGSRKLVYGMVALMCSMHVGIAITMRNTVLLGSVACCSWCIFLPERVGEGVGAGAGADPRGPSSSSSSRGRGDAPPAGNGESRKGDGGGGVTNGGSSPRRLVSAFLIAAFVSGSLWFETLSSQCDQSMEHVWSTLLHNRWNVFIGAEEYVTWELAPGRLANGSVVDVWSKLGEVSWEMPGTGAPCTSTARAGRWRSYPYLAELDGEDGEVLWGYLCRQWDEENGANDEGNEGRRLLRFNFFMLQADVLPNMGFSATRKRLIHSHDCTSDSNFAKEEDEGDGRGFDFASGEL